MEVCSRRGRLVLLTGVILWSIGCVQAAFMNYDRKLSVKMQSTLSPDPPSDVGILLKELTPRRRLREEHVLLTIDFPGTQHEFTLVLERIRGRGMCHEFLLQLDHKSRVPDDA
ncbi:hypothetical protein HNY73_022392 [Argiope bruennichi]|uniref:Uncharacterized protein n=1 Tax=Argiope bruennichi TaxID=94029 RepID=A0A8T0E2B4_ARGBR|nr:hypothetical protein HNY73_022392 [Argiope bruennichi]